MQNGKGWRRFALYIASAAVFVWFTSLRLPSLVASHFGASGTANGFMTRPFYMAFMVSFVIGLPTLMVLVIWQVVGNTKQRAETVAFLRAGVLWFGVLLVAFLCYVHTLVVLANETQPARLANDWFIGGMVVFFMVLIIAVRAFIRRLRRMA